MTPLVIFSLVALAALIWALRWNRVLSRQRAATLDDLEILFYSGPDPYAHLGRILGPGDFDFLAGSRRGQIFLRRLRKQRVASMWRSLGQMKEEFDSLIAIGSLFAAAPTAQAESFARRLARQRVRFYLMLYGLAARTLMNYFFTWPFEITPLSAEIRTLRRQADRILHALTPDDLGAMRNFLRSG